MYVCVLCACLVAAEVRIGHLTPGSGLRTAVSHSTGARNSAAQGLWKSTSALNPLSGAWTKTGSHHDTEKRHNYVSIHTCFCVYERFSGTSDQRRQELTPKERSIQCQALSVRHGS